MREIKLKEVDNTYETELKNGVKLKTFYTIAEMTAIIDDMKIKDEALDRLFTKVVLTATYNTNIDWADFTDNEIFDTCAELGLIEYFICEIPMYVHLDDIIKNDESVYKLIESFLGTVNTKLEGFDMTQILSGFVGLKDVIGSGKLV